MTFQDKFWGYGFPCGIILDNLPAHNLSKDDLQVLEIIVFGFTPPNVTSKRQTNNMGITACLKVGHKIIMLRKIFDIFDVEIGYELASERRSEQQNSCKVLAFGRKPTTLDIMKILHGI